MAEKPAQPSAALGAAVFDLMFGAWKNQAVFASLQLNIPDLLKDGKKHFTVLAKETGTVPALLHQLLRALSAEGLQFFHEDADGCFSNAASSAFLNQPKSMRWMLYHAAEEPSILALTKITDCLKSGKNAFNLANGKDVFDYYAEHPTSGEAFNKAMNNNPTGGLASQVYHFKDVDSLVDVGGGEGVMLTTILQAHPQIKRAALFDLPHVIPKETPHPLVELKGGSFFEAGDIPKGYKAYIMKHIIHDWDDEHCIKILTNCRNAMAEDGRILVVDSISPPVGDNSAASVKWLSLWMTIVTHGGKERTEEEFKALFAASGLKLSSKYNAPGSPWASLHVIEAVKA